MEPLTVYYPEWWLLSEQVSTFTGYLCWTRAPISSVPTGRHRLFTWQQPRLTVVDDLWPLQPTAHAIALDQSKLTFNPTIGGQHAAYTEQYVQHHIVSIHDYANSIDCGLPIIISQLAYYSHAAQLMVTILIHYSPGCIEHNQGVGQYSVGTSTVKTEPNSTGALFHGVMAVSIKLHCFVNHVSPLKHCIISSPCQIIIIHVQLFLSFRHGT